MNVRANIHPFSYVQSDVPASQRLDRPGSEGYIWPAEEDEHQSDDEDDFEDPYEHPENKRLLQLGGSACLLNQIRLSLICPSCMQDNRSRVLSV